MGSDGRSVIVPGRGNFRGKIQETFWAFMEPVLENEIVAVLAQAQEDIKNFRGALRYRHLEETRRLLQEKMVRGVFDDMLTVDQSLRGKGSPKKVLLKNIEDKLQRFDVFVNGQVRSTQKLLNRLNRKSWGVYFFFFLLGALTMFGLGVLNQFLAAG